MAISATGAALVVSTKVDCLYWNGSVEQSYRFSVFKLKGAQGESKSS